MRLFTNEKKQLNYRTGERYVANLSSWERCKTQPAKAELYNGHRLYFTNETTKEKL